MARRSWWRRLVPRMSVRALLILVLVIGGGSGWTIDRANRQRRIVAWIVRSGGSVTYDDRNARRDLEVEMRDPFPARDSWAPEWLVDRVGIDYFHRISTVTLQPHSDEEASDALDALEELGPPWIVTVHGPLFVDRFMGRLDELNGIEGLRLVSLPSNLTEKAGLANLARLPRLRFLAIVGSDFSDDGLQVVKSLKQLEYLDLSYSRITDAGLAQLESLPQLKSLVLGASNVTAAGLTHLQDLKRLDELAIENTRLDDGALEKLRVLHGLRRLSLRNTEISDAGIGDLIELTNLEELWLDGTRVSDAGRKELRGALPRTAIWPSIHEYVPRACKGP